MKPYLFMSVFAFVLVITQNYLLALLFSNKISIEISLLVVLYSVWSWEDRKGFFLTILLGLFMDWCSAPFYGLYSFSYVLIFLIANSLDTVLRSRAHGEILFVAFAVFIEFLILMIFYQEARNAGPFGIFWRNYLPQAVLLCIITPFLSKFMASWEARFLNE